MFAASILDDADRFIMAKFFFIGPSADQRVVHVGDGHETGRERDRLACQALRISSAVPTLMMRIGDFKRGAQERIGSADIVFGSSCFTYCFSVLKLVTR